MSCKDCIHFDVCGYATIPNPECNGPVADKSKECRWFKNKADFVEVVRCFECKYWETKNGGYCRASNALAIVNNENNDFCSYGERK